jgi:aerobic-type carbon monoxide dehydrogenase small subunit (CoxS/CutS family)
MAEIRFEATVNGRKIARTAKSHQRLLDFLRDDLGLTGAKEGCGAGECGTCSVLVDGVLMKSCLLPIVKAQASIIETVEALAKSGELSALRANPFADREEIKARLGGNLCRCTGYQKIFDAVEMARDVQNGRLSATIFDEEEVEQGDFIGKNVRSVDALGKVSGRLKYAGDMTMPGMLHVQVLRSPHASFQSIRWPPRRWMASRVLLHPRTCRARTALA